MAIPVEPPQILVDVYEKQGDMWVNKLYTEADKIISLPLLDIEFLIEDLYKRVKFDEE